MSPVKAQAATKPDSIKLLIPNTIPTISQLASFAFGMAQANVCAMASSTTMRPSHRCNRFQVSNGTRSKVISGLLRPAISTNAIRLTVAMVPVRFLTMPETVYSSLPYGTVTTQTATFITTIPTIKNIWNRDGSVPKLTARESWNSRL